MIHRLKCWPEYYAPVRDGLKNFDFRSVRDRQFAVGDVVVLEEWDPKTQEYTGRSCARRIAYIFDTTPLGAPGFVILGFGEES